MKIKYNITKKLIFNISIFLIHTTFGEKIRTPFEKSNSRQTTTYKEHSEWPMQVIL